MCGCGNAPKRGNGWVESERGMLLPGLWRVNLRWDLMSFGTARVGAGARRTGVDRPGTFEDALMANGTHNRYILWTCTSCSEVFLLHRPRVSDDIFHL